MQNTNPKLKAGIKTLTDIQIRNSLPGYDTLLKKFETVRENAAVLKNKLIIDGSFNSLKYDNIFSILGGRGAGKTSVLNTLYQKLGDNENNIRMPVIMPELVDDNDNFIGWILSAIETNLNELENKIKKGDHRIDEDDYNFFSRCVFNNNNKLRETFNQLKQAYYARVYNHRKGNWDYSTDFSLVSRVNDEGFSLIKRFAEFWNQLVDVYVKHIYKDKSTPLFFFFIDDADLKPSIINELIFCIPKYFSHPNVVVLISAAPKTLGYVVKNHMYQQITGSSFPLVDLMEIEKEYNGDIYQNSLDEEQQRNSVKFQKLRYGKEYVKITKLTEEILRKLFPVSNRFYLKKYEKYEDKALLVIEDGEDECICPISKIISRKLMNFKKEVSDLDKSNKPKKDDDLNESDNKCLNCDVPINNLVFFGKYPRDIVGGYYSFCDFIKELSTILKSYYEEKEKNVINLNSDMHLDKIRNATIRFLKAIISSNDNLFMFMQNVDKFILKKKDYFELYVDYSVVITTFEENQFIKANKNNPRPFFEMLILLDFVDNILDTARSKLSILKVTGHGRNVFCRLLDICDIFIINKCYSFNEIAEQYIRYENYGILLNFNMNSRTHQEYFLDVVYSIKLFPDEKRESNKTLALENKKWLETLCEVMYLYFGINNAIKQRGEEFKIMKKPMFCDEIYEEIYNTYTNSIHDIIMKNENIGRLSYSKLKGLQNEIEEFQTYILLMNSEFDKTTISFFSDEFEEYANSFYKELAYTDANETLKKEFLSFVNLIREYDYKISRHMLISKLNSIKLYVEKTEIYIYELSSWNYRLLNRLKMCSTIINVTYNNYYMDFIKENIPKYYENLYTMYSCAAQSLPRTESINDIKKKYYNIKDPYMKSYIDYLRQRDYNEFLKDD